MVTCEPIRTVCKLSYCTKEKTKTVSHWTNSQQLSRMLLTFYMKTTIASRRYFLFVSFCSVCPTVVKVKLQDNENKNDFLMLCSIIVILYSQNTVPVSPWLLQLWVYRLSRCQFFLKIVQASQCIIIIKTVYLPVYKFIPQLMLSIPKQSLTVI